MRYFQGFLILSALFIPATNTAWAQQKSYRPFQQLPALYGQSFLAGPQFNQMAREALASRPQNFNFTIFRAQYAQTRQYDPLGETAKKWLLKYSYAAQYEQDKAKRAQAFDDYAAMLADHLANIDIVNLALSLSRQDKRFGDPSFFEWLKNGLMQSLLLSGDGGNLARAYDVVTMGEEGALLAALNVELVKSDYRESGSLYYNMYEVRDAGQEGTRTIFVDASLPMRRLLQDGRAGNSGFAIPGQ